MAEILRLKKWTTYLHDGRSSVSCDARKGTVAVAVVVGFELAAPRSERDTVDVDSVIVDLAEYIQEKRQQSRKADKKRKAKSS